MPIVRHFFVAIHSSMSNPNIFPGMSFRIIQIQVQNLHSRQNVHSIICREIEIKLGQMPILLAIDFIAHILKG